MIHNIGLLHYLSVSTYQKIGGKLNLDTSESRIGENSITYANSPITRIHLFNIQYHAFGRIWFMHVTVGFPLFRCSCEDFIPVLYKTYAGLFGEDAMADFPKPEDINCDYVEYGATLDVGDAVAAVVSLRGKLAPEQLDKRLWDQYKKAHSTIMFLVNKQDDNHLEILARCHGTALKRIIKDTSQHYATGLRLPAALSRETETMVLKQQLDRHMKDTAYRLST